MTFSQPTEVTNPLFPIKDLHSVVLLGTVDEQSFRTETTLLPDTKAVEWEGNKVEALVSQYVAYLDGRIEEVALDLYAQADDGSVWYLGEDVFNYVDGEVADTEGTWITDSDTPAAMIMPADPQVGDAYRPENAFPVVFEEVTVKAIDRTVAGPQGDVDGAVVVEELHMEGTHEDKIFAPGYGEFSTGVGGDLEALAVAVPTDALAGPVSAELDAMLTGALEIFDAAAADDWNSVDATLAAMNDAWAAYRGSHDVPPMLDDQMDRALARLAGDTITPTIASRDPGGTRRASLDVAQATLDLRLRYLPPTEIDASRFQLWTDQLEIDTENQEPGAVAGDVVTLEWIRDRFRHTLDETTADQVDQLLDEMSTAAADEDFEAAAETNAQLQALLAEGSPS